MTTSTAPASIQIWEHEVANRYADPDLDLDYIDTTAAFVAVAIDETTPVEVCFQPGDGTRYNLVIIPPCGLASAPPRHDWERHAITGIRAPGVTDGSISAHLYYSRNAILVTWVERNSYAINLDTELTADYLAQKFGTTIVSGCTLAILFRAVVWHLAQRQL